LAGGVGNGQIKIIELGLRDDRSGYELILFTGFVALASKVN